MRQKRGLAVVCIGGGTGLSMLLRGIKEYAKGRRNGYELVDLDQLTAIVTVSDDGGSSGRLIDEFGVLPPGDIRRCMVALSDEDEIMSKLFEFRFKGEGELGGHSMGNLLLSALTQLNGGSFPKAIQDACRILAVRGQILPATLDSTTLCAELADGEVVRGESHIPTRVSREPIKRIFLEPRSADKPTSTNQELYTQKEKDFKCKVLVDAVLAIQQADAIIIGPGSLYTSIVPNLVVEDIAKAIQNSDALKIYVCNVVTQPGETDGYSVSDHVRAILDHAHIKLDYILVNNKIAPEELVKQYMKLQLHEQYTRIKRYAEEAIGTLEGKLNSSLEELKTVSERMAELSEEIKRIENASKIQVLHDPEVDNLKERLGKVQVIEEDLICDIEIIHMGVQKRVLRHDPEKLTLALMRLLMLHNKTKDQLSAVNYQPSAKKSKI